MAFIVASCRSTYWPMHFYPPAIWLKLMGNGRNPQEVKNSQSSKIHQPNDIYSFLMMTMCIDYQIEKLILQTIV
jgi:hypothetical protein